MPDVLRTQREGGTLARDLVVYTIVHQPRRLKLPAQPIPSCASAADIERSLFDEPLNAHYFRRVAHACYRPATQMFRELVEDGLKLNIGFSVSFLEQAQAWDPGLLEIFRGLVDHPNVELIGVEPYHSFIMLIDVERFIARMRWAREHLAQVFGRRPQVTDTTELCMSDPIYLALDQAGFAGGFLDGRSWVMGEREPSSLFHGGRALKLLVRHHRLSDDVGYRFSDRGWSGWPLLADQYTDWLQKTAGDLIVLGWDYETFGEHHSRATGIFEFMRWLPREAKARGLRFLTATEAIEHHDDRARALPLPPLPATWAGAGGMEFFLGNSAQQAVFQLMLAAYNKARLTGDEHLVDLALWLAQSDNLHLIQWFGRSGSEAQVSAYFTPREWWSLLGSDRIVWEIQEVYKNFIRAVDVQRRPWTSNPGLDTPSREPEIAGPRRR